MTNSASAFPMVTDPSQEDSVTASIAALFEPGGYTGPPRTGIELEVLPIVDVDGRPAPPRAPGDAGPSTLPVLRALAGRLGWLEEDGGAGLPRFVLPGGGVFSYEPGGQIEYASPATAHLPTLRDHLARLVDHLVRGMEAEGIRLLARGVDPTQPVSGARLHLEGDRYPRQRAHYDRRGPLGRVMMLQSAAVHLNVDLGSHPSESWRAANRLSPLLIALFANSPRRCGAPGARRSQRAALWRDLDPTRTGVFDGEGEVDTIADYHRFALEAESFLMGSPDEAPRPFRVWLERGADVGDLRRHLTTLFPEVRPRGYLEIRSLDALPARLAMVAAAVTVALVHGQRARAELLRHIPPASRARVERAGHLGVTDPGLRQEVLRLHDVVQDGLAELGEEVSDKGLRRAVTTYFEDFPARGLDPGTRPESWIDS